MVLLVTEPVPSLRPRWPSTERWRPQKDERVLKGGFRV